MTAEPIRIAPVCVRNAGRSQMATTLARHERGRRSPEDDVEVVTGRTHPADRIREEVVEAMAEEGFALTDRTSRPITTAELEACDLLATMGCSTLGLDAASASVDVRDWALDDPRGEDADRVREIRENVRSGVSRLLDEIEQEVISRA